MKKVININFQGRVIPIEETAYEMLKQYIDSLRRYFANEEGRDEIINDIEGRIAELFSERLKKGSTCITDDDVNAVINSMGRPEDLEAESAELGNESRQKSSGSSQQSQQSFAYSPTGTGRGRLYRNSDDKVVGGVCSGLANYFNIDPVIMRIIFVLLFFTGPGFLLYIILWIVIPSQSLKTNITKRLYRSSDSKVIAGVCGGLSAYFNIDVWIPRLIFALPLIIGIISGPVANIFDNWGFWWGPKIITNSLGGTLFVTYIILWIALPVATTAAEKLEMRGERVDLNSIRDTVKEDLESLKSRAQSFGTEVKESAQQFGEKAKEFGQSAGNQARGFAAEAAPVARRTGSGIGHVIGVLFKAFFLFIGGIIGIALLAAMAAIFGVGVAMMPFRGYFLDNNWQYILAWSTLLLFFGIPVLAFLVWIIRKIAGSPRNPTISYAFGFLWILGLFSFIALIASINRSFTGGARISNEVTISTGIGERVIVKMAEPRVRYYGGWMNFGDGVRFTEDSLEIANVGMKIEKSPDTGYHLSYTRYSFGRGDAQAEELARNIGYTMTQSDSTIYLDRNFAIHKGEKFRNQHVVVTIQVPVGKRIVVDRSVGRQLNRWFSIGVPNTGWNRGGSPWDWDDRGVRWYYGEWDRDVEYIMTPGGLERVDQMDAGELKKGKFKMKINDEGVDIEAEGDFRDSENNGRYRYHRSDSVSPKIDSVSIKIKTSVSQNTEEETASERESIVNIARNKISEAGTPLSVFTGLFY